MNRFKPFIVLVLMITFSFALCAADDNALYFQAGTLTPDNFKFDLFYAIAGFTYTFHIGELVMLNPELYIVVEDLKFKRLELAPALIANVKLGNFFIGLGPTKWYKLGSEAVTTDWMMKINIGLTKNRMIYTLFAVVDFTKNNDYNSMIGLKLGFDL